MTQATPLEKYGDLIKLVKRNGNYLKEFGIFCLRNGKYS